MKRLTKRNPDWPAWPLLDRPRGALCTAKFCTLSDRCDYIGDRTCQYLQMVDRLAAIEDILGDEYDFDRLRVIMDAEQHGGLIVGYGPGDPGEPGELGVIEEVAADNVVVVRCRECIYRDGTPGQPNILCGQMHDDDFCSYGQRKETDHDKHPSDPM